MTGVQTCALPISVRLTSLSLDLHAGTAAAPAGGGIQASASTNLLALDVSETGEWCRRTIDCLVGTGHFSIASFIF